MNAEFVDTNILIYAHDGGAGIKHAKSVELLARLMDQRSGVISTQVLSEFYSVATSKLGMKSEEAEQVLEDLASWSLHRPSLTDLLEASRLHRKHQLPWWDALILNGALQAGCSVLWSEDFQHGQKYGQLIVRNPFV